MKTIARRRRHRLYGRMEIIERIEELAAERRLNWTDLGIASGISNKTFNKWKETAEEHKKKRARKENVLREGGPTLRQGVAIAKALGVPPEALVLSAEEMPERLVLTEHERTIFEVYRSLGSPDHQKVIRAISAIAEAEKHEPIVGRRTETPGKGRSRLPGGDQNG